MADKAKSPDPVDRTPSPNAERQAKQHNSKTGSPKPVGAKRSKSSTTGRKAVKSTPTTVGAQPAAKTGGVSVSLDKRLEEVLDNLRGHVSRHEYLQQLVTAHLNAADPNGIHVEDDDLPGNEKQMAALTGKVPTGTKKPRPEGVPGNELDNFIPGHVPPITPADHESAFGNERDNQHPSFTR